MTYRSLIIEEYAVQTKAVAPYNRSAKRVVFASLNRYAWPTDPEAFEMPDNPKYFVDNCWVRVPVDPPTLCRFLESGCHVDPEVPQLISRVRADRWYVINDEEF